MVVDFVRIRILRYCSISFAEIVRAPAASYGECLRLLCGMYSVRNFSLLEIRSESSPYIGMIVAPRCALRLK